MAQMVLPYTAVYGMLLAVTLMCNNATPIESPHHPNDDHTKAPDLDLEEIVSSAVSGLARVVRSGCPSDRTESNTRLNPADGLIGEGLSRDALVEVLSTLEGLQRHQHCTRRMEGDSDAETAKPTTNQRQWGPPSFFEAQVQSRRIAASRGRGHLKMAQPRVVSSTSIAMLAKDSKTGLDGTSACGPTLGGEHFTTEQSVGSSSPECISVWMALSDLEVQNSCPLYRTVEVECQEHRSRCNIAPKASKTPCGQCGAPVVLVDNFKDQPVAPECSVCQHCVQSGVGEGNWWHREASPRSTTGLSATPAPPKFDLSKRVAALRNEQDQDHQLIGWTTAGSSGQTAKPEVSPLDTNAQSDGGDPRLVDLQQTPGNELRREPTATSTHQDVPHQEAISSAPSIPPDSTSHCDKDPKWLLGIPRLPYLRARNRKRFQLPKWSRALTFSWLNPNVQRERESAAALWDKSKNNAGFEDECDEDEGECEDSEDEIKLAIKAHAEEPPPGTNTFHDSVSIPSPMQGSIRMHVGPGADDAGYINKPQSIQDVLGSCSPVPEDTDKEVKPRPLCECPPIEVKNSTSSTNSTDPKG